MRSTVLVLCLALATTFSWATPVTVQEVLVVGLPAAEQEHMRSSLPVKVGQVYRSARSLRRRAALVQSYLMQDGAYTNVSVEVEEFSDTEAGVYVLLQNAAIGSLEALGVDLTVIPHFPLYRVGLTLGIEAYEQSLGLDVPLVRALRLGVLAGHTQTVGGVHALSGRAGFTLRPFPLLSFHVPWIMDAYLGAEPGRRLDMAVAAGAKLDLSYLAAGYLVGGSLEASGRYGLADFRYLAGRVRGTLAFVPFAFLTLSVAAQVDVVTGDPSPTKSLDDAARRALRVPPSAPVGGQALGCMRGLITLRTPLRLNLSVTSLTLGVYGFVEGYGVYGALADVLGGGATAAGGALPSALGGGVLLEFGAPMSITFGLGYGYSLVDRRSAFVFTVS